MFMKKARAETRAFFLGNSLWVPKLHQRRVLLRVVFRFGVAFLTVRFAGAAFFNDKACALERTELTDRRSFSAMSPVSVFLYACFR